MNISRSLRRLTLPLFAVWLLFGAALEASVSTRISSRFLARGERALLEVAVLGKRPTASPEIAPIEGVKIQPAGRGPTTQFIPGRRVEHVYSYVVSSYEVGTHRIEPISIQIGDDTFMTQPLDFSVFNPDELTWSTAMAGDTEFRYASAFKVLDDQPYVNQAVPVEIKVFVPRDLFVIDWGIPDFTRDGLTAWRMQPREMRSEINLLGMPYISVAYPSTLTPNRRDEVAIGPASIRLISTQVVMERVLKRKAVETRIQVPELKLNVKELPPNAPTGFDNAVGQFKLQVRTKDTEVREGDPIPVDILVTGSGNLDTLRPPAPISPLGWKLYEPSRQQRGDERRELSGSVSFQQFLRPLELKSNIPPYKLVFFNPETERYDSIQTEAIVLDMTPAPALSGIPAGPPPAAGTPIEEMTDILGLIPNARLTRDHSIVIAQWWMHALGGALALLLIGRALWLRFNHLLQSDPIRRQQLAELKSLESERQDDREFLMSAGRFIERWLGKASDQQLREILDERDANCFRAESAESTRVEPKRRKAILAALRRSTTTCLMIIALGFASAGFARAEDPNQSARDAYESARYDEAIETWLQAADYQELSADTLYHIGNACYRAGSTGHAALYYRRALARDPQHAEARQNLRFIERKVGALTIKRPDHQYLLARLPLEAWQTITWAGAWICLLSLLCFTATRNGARLRYIAVTALAISPLLAIGGGLGWKYYPTDAVFATLESQAVIVAPKSNLHSEASRNSSIVIPAPPGSLCEVLHQSGEWSYVAFATQTRGWIPTSGIRRILPEEDPEVPEIKKPVADETSA